MPLCVFVQVQLFVSAREGVTQLRDFCGWEVMLRMYTWTHKVVKLKRSIPPLNENVCAHLPALSVCLSVLNHATIYSGSPIWFLVFRFWFLIWCLQFGFWFSDLVFGSPIWLLVLRFGFWFSDLM